MTAAAFFALGIALVISVLNTLVKGVSLHDIVASSPHQAEIRSRRLLRIETNRSRGFQTLLRSTMSSDRRRSAPTSHTVVQAQVAARQSSSRPAARSTLRACVKRYSDDLNALKAGLGDSIAKHPLEVNTTSNRELIIGAGFGSTATRSLAKAVQLLSLNPVHCCGTPDVTKFMAKWDLFTERTSTMHRFTQQETAQCVEQLRNFDYTSIPDTVDAIFDTPVAETFLNLFVTFPKAKYILSTRDAHDWVAHRKKWNSRSSFAPMEEPCGLLVGYPEGEFEDRQLERMFDLHNDLVRCSVPNEQLVELNVWSESKTRMQGLMHELAIFLGRPAPSNQDFPREGAYRRRRRIAAASMSESHVAMKQDQVDQKLALGDTYRPECLTNSTDWNMSYFGRYMQDAVQNDCEIGETP